MWHQLITAGRAATTGLDAHSSSCRTLLGTYPISRMSGGTAQTRRGLDPLPLTPFLRGTGVMSCLARLSPSPPPRPHTKEKLDTTTGIWPRPTNHPATSTTTAFPGSDLNRIQITRHISPSFRTNTAPRYLPNMVSLPATTHYSPQSALDHVSPMSTMTLRISYGRPPPCQHNVAWID